MNVYMVSATFGAAGDPNGIICLNAVIMPSSEAAAAAAIAMFVQSQKIELPLQGINVQEIKEDFLVAALAAIRGQTAGGSVVRLAQPSQSFDQLSPQARPVPEDTGGAA